MKQIAKGNAKRKNQKNRKGNMKRITKKNLKGALCINVCFSSAFVFFFFA